MRADRAGPPHDLKAEVAVLGAFLLSDVDPAVLAPVLDLLKPADLYFDGHQRVFAALVRLHARGAPVDLVTVADELRKAGDLERAGGEAYLTELADGAVTAAHVEHHARIVREHAGCRALIQAGEQIATLGRNGADVTTIRERGIVLLQQIAHDGTPPRAASPGPVLVRLDTVRPEAVIWLWPGRIPRGKLAVVIGDPGLGKSFPTLQPPWVPDNDEGDPIGAWGRAPAELLSKDWLTEVWRGHEENDCCCIAGGDFPPAIRSLLIPVGTSALGMETGSVGCVQCCGSIRSTHSPDRDALLPDQLCGEH